MLANAFVLFAAVGAPSYGITDLRLDSDGAVFLNDRGTVAGHRRAGDGTPDPFVWRKGEVTEPKGVRRIAGINARDQLAVDAVEGPGIWGAREGLRLWPRTPSDGMFATVPRALGIDDSGNLTVVLAPLGSEGGHFRVVGWPRARRIEETYPPAALASDGSILARSGRGALLYDERSRQAVGEGDRQIQPIAAARDGWVCGAYATPDDARPRPFVWHRGRFIDPFWGVEGKAVAVNDRGEAVGEADGTSVLWTGGAAQELEALIGEQAGYRIVEALAINAKAQILVLAEPKERPFPRTLLLLTPKRERR